MNTKERMDTAIRIEVLPAGWGDCLFLTCLGPTGTWRLLVDTGPSETWPALRARLCALPSDGTGKRTIDLAIVTHIDADHIGAAHLLFGDQALGLVFGDVWFNGRRHLERGAAQGEALSLLLGAPERDLPWNRAFAGGAASTPSDQPFLELPVPQGQPRLTLLSPTPKQLSRMCTVWDAELKNLRARRSNTERESESERGASEFPDLERLASHQTDDDRSISNASSIAILVEHRGASALLAADALASVLGRALLGLAKKRGVALPMHVDAFKLSHHGSRANLRTTLLSAISAERYVVSTDNTHFGHPNDETLARVIVHGGAAPELCFNFATDRNLRWDDPALKAKYRFMTHFPAPGGPPGIVIDLPARE